MGKHGRAAKRARLQREVEAPLDGIGGSSCDDCAGLTAADLALTARVLHALGGRLDVFSSPRCKALRFAMAPLVQAQLARAGGSSNNNSSSAATWAAAGVATAPVPPTSSLIGLVSDALRYSRWADAVTHLRQLRAAGVVPRLGSAQRWVRDTDASREDSAHPGPRWLALDAIVRACAPGGAATSTTLATLPGAADRQSFHVLRESAFCAPGAGTIASSTAPAAASSPLSSAIELDNEEADRGGAASSAVVTSSSSSLVASAVAHAHSSATGATASPAAASPTFVVVSHTPAAARQPPNRFDQTIYYGAPVTLVSDRSGLEVRKRDVPRVAGAFLLSNVLSASECDAIVRGADGLGWVPDEVLAVGYEDGEGGGAGSNSGELNAGNVIWLADTAFINTLFQRMAPHLPPSLRGEQIVALNARCRLYNYSSQARYRPHLDGGWPSSGLVDGVYAYDVSAASAQAAAAGTAVSGALCADGGGGGGRRSQQGGRSVARPQPTVSLSSSSSSSLSSSSSYSLGSNAAEETAFPVAAASAAAAAAPTVDVTSGKPSALAAAAAAAASPAGGCGSPPPTWSRLTVVLYLNGGTDGAFDGGNTTFFMPGEPGTLLALGVAPQIGSVLVFPHGEYPHPSAPGGFLVHEGSTVTRGRKLILRTDVLYTVHG